MPPVNIEELPVPRKAFRIDRQSAGYEIDFETIDSSSNEELKRSRRSRRRSTLGSDLINAEQAVELANRLDHSGSTREFPRSLASALYMRLLRVRIVGALLLLLSILGALSATTFTIIPKSWEFTPEEFDRVVPQRLRNAFRTAVYEKGAASIQGWLIAFIHGEFDPVARIYRLHLHGLCSHSMLKAIDALRNDPNYKAERILPSGDWSSVYRRVWVRRKALDNLASALSYLVQSFWPSRPIYISQAGKRRRVRDKRRMPEPYHSQVLLWLDRWRLADLTLMIGLRVTKSGLKQTHRGS